MKSCELDSTVEDLLDDTSRDFSKRSTKTKCCFSDTSSSKAGFYILAKQNSRDNQEENEISKVQFLNMSILRI